MKHKLIIFFYILFSFYSISPLNKVILKQVLPDNAIIIEAGAFDGGDTQEIAELLPNAHIYAFEPLPNLFSILKKKTQKNLRMFIVFNWR